MNTYALKLITIVTEPILTAQILAELKRLGSTGATISEVRGEGTKQLHSSEVPGEKTKIESIVSPEVAEKILAHIATKYFSNYSVIAYMTEAHVVRVDKYRPNAY